MNLAQFGTFDYDVSGAEETTITSVSAELIQESILNQFKDPSGYAKVDFVQSFFQRYKLTLKEIADDYDEDEISATKELHRKFIGFMEKTLMERLSIGITDLDNMGDEEQEQMVHYLYRFFIINLNQNMYNFFLHYIEKHKSALAEVLPATKTVSIRRLTEIVEDPDMIKICAWISEVTKYITEQEISVDDYFELCMAKEYDLEREFTMQQYEEFAVSGNFIERYLSMIPEPIMVELESEMIAYLTRKYRKPKEEPPRPAEPEVADIVSE